MKKLISIILTAVLIVLLIAPGASAAGYDYTLPSGTIINASSGSKGDVSGDNKVSLEDVSLMFRWWNGTGVSLNTEKIDFNHDGKSDLRDAAALFRFCSGNCISDPAFSAEMTGNTLKLTVANTVSGKEYLLICRSGKDSIFTLSDEEVGKIVYIDQQKASGSSIAFSFKVPEGTEGFSAFVSSTDSAIGNKAFLTIPG